MSEKKYPRIGVGVMILVKGKVLLGKRNSDANKADSELHGEGTWTMPGGKLEWGEKLIEAVKREVFEETGVKIDNKKLKQISLTDDIVKDSHFVTVGFLCKDFPGKPKVLESDEITEWKWFSLENLPSQIFFPSQEILDIYTKK